MPARRQPHSKKPQPRAARLRLPAALARGLGRALGALLVGVSRLVLARPVLFAGSAAFLGVSSIVASNALTGQGAAHPHPMVATRSLEAVRTASEGGGGAAGPQPWHPVNDPRVMTVPLVKEVQVLLAGAGYYEAEIDGRPGQATDRAIRTFQAERGLRVDGMATPLLLTQIRQLTGATPNSSSRPEGTEYASLDDLMSDLPTDDIPILDEEPADPDMVRQIQAGLAGASVADIKADGIMGEQTRAAIRTFQTLEGMDVTGEPSVELLERLNAMGGRS